MKKSPNWFLCHQLYWAIGIALIGAMDVMPASAAESGSANPRTAIHADRSEEVEAINRVRSLMEQYPDMRGLPPSGMLEVQSALTHLSTRPVFSPVAVDVLVDAYIAFHPSVPGLARTRAESMLIGGLLQKMASAGKLRPDQIGRMSRALPADPQVDEILISSESNPQKNFLLQQRLSATLDQAGAPGVVDINDQLQRSVRMVKLLARDVQDFEKTNSTISNSESLRSLQEFLRQIASDNKQSLKSAMLAAALMIAHPELISRWKLEFPLDALKTLGGEGGIQAILDARRAYLNSETPRPGLEKQHEHLKFVSQDQIIDAYRGAFRRALVGYLHELPPPSGKKFDAELTKEVMLLVDRLGVHEAATELLRFARTGLPDGPQLPKGRSAEWRAEVVRVAKWLNHPDANQILFQALRDPDREVRQEAVDALMYADLDPASKKELGAVLQAIEESGKSLEKALGVDGSGVAQLRRNAIHLAWSKSTFGMGRSNAQKDPCAEFFLRMVEPGISALK